jgi:predicted nucleotidyltransferase
MEPTQRLEAFVREAAERLRADERIVAAWLGGSLAAGNADGYSDVDLRIAVADEAFDAFVATWETLVERLAPTVLRRRIGPPEGPIITAITPEWLRFDVAIVRSSTPDRLGDRVLFDRRTSLPAASTPPAADPAARLPVLVEEFLRVLGLSRVAHGRDEVILATHGGGLLRWSLVELFLIENRARRGGMLHLNQYLSAEQRAILETLPIDPWEHHAAVARAFLPRARALMAAHGHPYPDALERATFTYLDGLISPP